MANSREIRADRRPRPNAGLLRPALTVVRTCAVALTVLWYTPVNAQQTDTTGVAINGRLLDDIARAPVARGNVQLLRADSSMIATVVTDTAGRFRLTTAVAGPYRLRAEQLGYQTTVSAKLEFVAGSTIELDFLIAVNAVPLQQIVVRATKLPAKAYYESVGMDQFHRRMMQWQRRNSGTFLTRDSLERYERTTTSLMLSQFPGIWYDGPGRLRMRGECTPRYFLNEIPLTVAAGMSIDDMFRPEQLEAVEIYVGSAVPGEYYGRGCGVIAFWTRRS